MSVGSPRPEAKAVGYAETSLNVHAVYEEAQAALGTLRRFMDDSTHLSDWKRRVQEELTDREMMVVSEERAANPDMSQAAFDRHIKIVLQLDGTMIALRGKVLDLQLKLDEANASVAHSEATIRVLTSRMHELGGLLAFYAAAKKGSV